MPYVATTATRKLLKLRKRIRAAAGGTSAGKTVSIIQILIDYCQTRKNKLVHVVSESYPHLEAGAMLDFQTIMREHGYWDQDCWNETKHKYTFETGTVLRFYSVDLSNAHGPRRDVLYINEANNIPWNVFEQLEPRTRETVWLDWNPTQEFWFYTDLQTARDEDVDFLTLTYLDNEALDAATVKSIESRRENKKWWTVYGLGQLGDVEGKIFTDWQVLDEIPHEARLERRGMDFGYSNDPTAIVDVYSYNGGIILDEQLYQKGMSNKQIADFLKNLPNPQTLVVADSSEPKSIDEIASYGVNIIGANKGQGSVLQGIQKLQDQRVSMTKRSINLHKEYRNYMWITDKDGKIVNVPQDIWNHLLDATRYANETLKPTKQATIKRAAWVSRAKQHRR